MFLSHPSFSLRTNSYFDVGFNVGLDVVLAQQFFFCKFFHHSPCMRKVQPPPQSSCVNPSLFKPSLFVFEHLHFGPSSQQSLCKQVPVGHTILSTSSSVPSLICQNLAKFSLSSLARTLQNSVSSFE